MTNASKNSMIVNIGKVGVAIFSTKELLWRKINASIRIRIMKNPYLDLTPGKIKFSNTFGSVLNNPKIQQLPRILLGELNLNFLIYASRHHYKHIGEKISW